MEKIFNLYGIGGCGINVLDTFLQTANEFVLSNINNIVGVDTSRANPPVSEFEIEYMPDAEGSGGKRNTHADRYPDYAKQILAKHTANKLNIVAFGLAGGTGAGFGPYLVRRLLQMKVPVLVIIVGDTTTVNEQNNTVGALNSLYNQTRLGHPVIIDYMENSDTTSQGDINKRAANTISNAIVTFSPVNQRIDYADIFNFFYFTDVIESAEPVISQLSFLVDSDVDKYTRNPIAAISLYHDINNIRAPFQGMLYRKAGIFGEPYLGKSEDNFHAVIDHGNTIDYIQEMINKRDSRRDEIAGKFKAKKLSSATSNIDDDGMDL